MSKERIRKNDHALLRVIVLHFFADGKHANVEINGVGATVVNTADLTSPSNESLLGATVKWGSREGSYRVVSLSNRKAWIEAHGQLHTARVSDLTPIKADE